MRKFLLKMIWNRRNKVWEILVEQFFIVMVLMLCLGSLFSALKKYNDPGLLNTDNTFVFSCMPVNFNCVFFIVLSSSCLLISQILT